MTGDADTDEVLGVGFHDYARLRAHIDARPSEQAEALSAEGVEAKSWTEIDARWQAMIGADADLKLSYDVFHEHFYDQLEPEPGATRTAKSAPPPAVAAGEPRAAERTPSQHGVPTYLQSAPLAAVRSVRESPAEPSADETGAVDIRQLSRALTPFAGKVQSIPRTESERPATGNDVDDDAAGETTGLDIRQLGLSATPFDGTPADDPLEGTALAVEIPPDMKAIPFSKPTGGTTAAILSAGSQSSPEPDEDDPVGETTGVDVRQLMAAATPFASSPKQGASHSPALPPLADYVRLGVELGSCAPERVDPLLRAAGMSRTTWAQIDATYRARMERERGLRAAFDAALANERARLAKG